MEATVNEFVLVLTVAAVVMLFLLAEITAATLPLLIMIIMVPPEERPALAQLVAAIDSSHKLRLWTTLRAAVIARRQTCKCGMHVGGNAAFARSRDQR
jgi:hypothetical protein